MRAFPIPPAECCGIPINLHPGAFGAVRKHDIHTGVDLYVRTFVPVWATNKGKVIAVKPFTGRDAGSPWWLNTKGVAIETETGQIHVFGEIKPCVKVGDVVRPGATIGHVIPVLPAEKHRRDIRGHSVMMLHFEIYTSWSGKWLDWELNGTRPSELIDPTPSLMSELAATGNNSLCLAQ